MNRDSNKFLTAGDALLKAGDVVTAAEKYSRYADESMAESCLDKARACVDEDPIAALKVLARAEQIQGASGEGRRISARAYSRLGQREIAARFLSAIE